jgi:hypothetical protein
MGWRIRSSIVGPIQPPVHGVTRVLSPGVKRPGRGVDHPPSSSARVKEIVELYLYSPSGPSWPVLGWTIFPPNGSTAPWGPRPPHFSKLHDHFLDTPHSVGLLWTSDQPVGETSTWQHTTLTTIDFHALGGIRTRNPSKRATTGIGRENLNFIKKNASNITYVR